MPQSKTAPRKASFKTTISDVPSAWPKWVVEITNWSLATIAMIGIGMAITTQFLPFNLALQSVLTGLACGAFWTIVRSLVARRKRGKDQGAGTSAMSHLSKR